jgi:hypothetical protein
MYVEVLANLMSLDIKFSNYIVQIVTNRLHNITFMLNKINTGKIPLKEEVCPFLSCCSRLLETASKTESFPPSHLGT